MIVKVLEKRVGFFLAFFQVWKEMYIMRNDDKSMADGGGETAIIQLFVIRIKSTHCALPWWLRR